MIRIADAVRENGKEAWNILKSHGGKLKFLENYQEIYDEEGYIDIWDNHLYNYGGLISCGDRSLYVYVLEVSCGKKEGDFKFVMWYEDDEIAEHGIIDADELDFLDFTDNKIYEAIYDHFNEK